MSLFGVFAGSVAENNKLLHLVAIVTVTAAESPPPPAAAAGRVITVNLHNFDSLTLHDIPRCAVLSRMRRIKT